MREREKSTLLCPWLGSLATVCLLTLLCHKPRCQVSLTQHLQFHTTAGVAKMHSCPISDNTIASMYGVKVYFFFKQNKYLSFIILSKITSAIVSPLFCQWSVLTFTYTFPSNDSDMICFIQTDSKNTV